MIRRKILFYTHALSGGGAERAWALLASSFAARGHDVIFATDQSADENTPFVDMRVKQIVLPDGHYASLRRLRRLLAEESPDVFLSALGSSNLKLMSAAASLGRLDRCIISLHGYFRSEGQLLSRIGNVSTPIASRLCGATVCVSDVLLQYVLKKWKLSPTRTHRIYNPVIIKTPYQTPDAAELRAREPRILAVGRLISCKSYPMLIEAFSRLRTPGATLTILGEGPDRPKIEAQIKSLGLVDRIQLPGYKTQPWSFYSEAKCFALASSSESFSNVVVEALANGLPVVATRCHGPEEIIQNGAQGALIDIGDVKGMAEALDAALAAPGEPSPRVERAGRFNADAACDAYGTLIEAVIAKATRWNTDRRVAPKQ